MDQIVKEKCLLRPGRPSDKFVSPYPNVNASMAANGGAYPPDMSVLVKARPGGSNYIYSVLDGIRKATCRVLC